MTGSGARERVSGPRVVHFARSKDRRRAHLAYVYFPLGATVSLTTAVQDGSLLEVAAVGTEGVVGVCTFLGGGPALGSAIVQRAGTALRLPATALREAARQSLALHQMLTSYTLSLLSNMAQTSLCVRRHRLEQQLCRWLLVHLDRQRGTVITVTHDSIAQLLGVRRKGVTAVALRLQQAGLIRYARGRIELVDRGGLEARACECYAAVRDVTMPRVDPHPCAVALPRYGT